MTRQQIINNCKFLKCITPTTLPKWHERLLIITDGYKPEATKLLTEMIKQGILLRARPYARTYTLHEEAANANIAYRSIKRLMLQQYPKW